MSAAMVHNQDDDDFFGDLAPIVEDDLAAFVRDEDRYRSLTVIEGPGTVDLEAETRRWLDRVRADKGEVQACHAMRIVLERWADGSREGQKQGALALVRMDERGHRGLTSALSELWSVRAKDPRDFRRLIEWARQRVVTKPSPRFERGCTCDGLMAVRKHARESGDGEDSGEQAEGEASGPEPTGLARFLLPRELWCSTPALKHIYAASMARICSPDAVLHAVLAVIASYLHHGTRVDTGKRPSVLSYYFAPIAYSGGGKSEALACARDLLAGWAADRFAINGYHGQDYIDAPLGSGEGLIEAFMGEIQRDVKDDDGNLVLNGQGNPKSVKVREQARHNALFHTDEGRQALAIDSRKGSTLFAVLCELWSGSVTGQTNAERDRCRKLAEGSYVVAAMMGFQPGTVDPLFDDQAGGAPQRFMFAPAEYAPHAEHPDAPEDPWPGDLELQINPGPVTVRLGTEQRALVRRHVRIRAGGGSEDGTLDGHRMLLRCRLAALLTLLHGDTINRAEVEVPVEMWDMAGVVLDKSCELRDWLSTLGQGRRAAEARAADERRRVLAVQTERDKAADAERRERERVYRVAASVARRVAKGEGDVDHRALKDTVGRYRKWLDDAITEALERGWIERSGRRYRSGPRVGDIPPS